jgi:hypothetical protein
VGDVDTRRVQVAIIPTVPIRTAVVTEPGAGIKVQVVVPGDKFQARHSLGEAQAVIQVKVVTRGVFL